MSVFRFTLSGLIIFSVALIGGSACITYELGRLPRSTVARAGAEPRKDPRAAVHTGPWGDISTREIKLERPVEYLGEEVSNPQTPETWFFKGMHPEAVKALLEEGGVTAAQVAAAFTPDGFRETSAGTEFTPSMEFLLSFDSPTRRALYASLSGQGVNSYLDTPLVFSADTVDALYTDSRLRPEDARLLRQLVYPNGHTYQLADYEALLWHIPTVERRVAMTRALSQQTVVLAKLEVGPHTNIDELAGYWGHMPNVRFSDIRPLFESLKKQPEGGNLSLLFVLPPFARERLYTYPLPPKPGEPLMDCHWSTFNFSNDVPDNRFNEPEYVVQHIQNNYYQIGTPTVYGDVIVLLDDTNRIKHSSVYIAADLTFTKNGSNHRQPWVLMRIPDMLQFYAADPPLRVAYFRRKVD